MKTRKALHVLALVLLIVAALVVAGCKQPTGSDDGNDDGNGTNSDANGDDEDGGDLTANGEIQDIQVSMFDSEMDSIYLTSDGNTTTTDAWHTYSVLVDEDGIGYDGGAVQTGITAYRLKANTAEAGVTFCYYVDNILLSNGTDDALSIPVNEGDDYSSAYVANGDQVTIETVQVDNRWVLKIVGTSTEAYGSSYVSVQFDLASAADVSAGDYTASFDF
ncbi:MAG: hypothetical protein ACOC0O_01080, partial [Spirochaetota bacterium]